MSLSFTQEYYPDIEELSDAQISEAREKIVLALQPVMPEVDLAPGTPTGDFVVTPLAAYRAAAEEANRRLMSDLDLANVADGLIYSCAFVRAYLGNFAVYDVENLKATGLVRLTYSSGAARTIPRTVRFRFGTDDDWSLKVATPDISEITVLSAGSEHTGAPDTYIFAQTSATTWAVDVPVEAVMTGPVVAGSSGTATEIDDDLVGIAAAIDFMSGLPSASLKDLAKMARKTAFSLTAGSRASIRSMIYRNWPETTMASPVVPGDPELQRVAPGSAMALQAPAVDVYMRSIRDMQREVQNIRLDYVQPDGDGPKVFRGVLPLLHRPSRILGIEWSGTTNESYVTSYKVYSKSGRSDLYGSLHCGTRYESLYVELIPIVDESDVPLIPITDVTEDGDSKQYAIFTVTYDADPLLETISSLLESPDYRPAGVDVLVKSGPLVLIDQLDITYTKKNGVKTTLSVARNEIVEYVRTAGHPDPFRVTELHDIVRNSGADRVMRINALGRVFVSAAERVFRNSITAPSGADLLVDWEAESDELRVIPWVGTDNAVPFEIIDGEISVGGPPDAWAATSRTCRYCVDPDNVRFIEV
jgi:hypothetical protein